MCEHACDIQHWNQGSTCCMHRITDVHLHQRDSVKHKSAVWWQKRYTLLNSKVQNGPHNDTHTHRAVRVHHLLTYWSGQLSLLKGPQRSRLPLLQVQSLKKRDTVWHHWISCCNNPTSVLKLSRQMTEPPPVYNEEKLGCEILISLLVFG